jgi:hypothetical protein
MNTREDLFTKKRLAVELGFLRGKSIRDIASRVGDKVRSFSLFPVNPVFDLT